MNLVINPITGLLDRVNQVIKIYDAVVDITGGGDFTTVEAAVDAGHRTIFIKSGTYPFDNLLITKSGTILIGESKIDTILDAGGFNVHISDDGVSVINDVEIRNLSLINYDGGVSPEGIIQPSEFTSGATGWIIDNCIFSGNATNLGADIHVKGSNMTITNNIFKSSIGINFTAGTGDTIISGNYFFDSRIKTTGGAIGVSTASLFIKGNYFTFASAVAPSINILASRCMIS